MATEFVQTDTAAGATNVQCSGNSQNTDRESNRAQQGGTAGSTPRTVTIDASAADLNAVWMEIVNIDNYDGASGTWTWRINISTGNHQLTLDEVHICHVDSSYGAKNTIGSSVGLGLNIAATGDQSGNITQSSSVTIAPGDMIIVIFAFDNAQTMTNDFAYTPSSTISAPGTIEAAQSRTVNDTQPNFNDQIQARLMRALSISDSLLGIPDSTNSIQEKYFNQSDVQREFEDIINNMQGKYFSQSDAQPYFDDNVVASWLRAAIQQTISDTLEFFDTLSRRRGFVRDDSLTFSDTVAIVARRRLLFSDLLTSSDSVNRSILKRLLDLVTFTESIATGKFKPATINDALALFESYTKLRGLGRDDESDIQDAVVKGMSLTADDILRFADSVDPVKLALGLTQQIINDTLDLSDDESKLMSRVLLEQLDLSDDNTRQVLTGLLERIINDELTFADTVNSLRILAAAITDSLTFSDELEKLIAKLADDTLEFSDEAGLVVLGLGLIQQAVNDQLDLGDDALTKLLGRVVEALVTIDDDILKGMSLSLADNMSFTDAVFVSKLIKRVLDDDLDLRDDMVWALGKVIGDETVTSDDLSKLVGRVMQEQVDFSDSVSNNVTRAILVIAAYLDSRLSGRNDLTERISRVIGHGYSGTKGHVR